MSLVKSFRTNLRTLGKVTSISTTPEVVTLTWESGIKDGVVLQVSTNDIHAVHFFTSKLGSSKKCNITVRTKFRSYFFKAKHEEGACESIVKGIGEDQLCEIAQRMKKYYLFRSIGLLILLGVAYIYLGKFTAVMLIVSLGTMIGLSQAFGNEMKFRRLFK